MNKKSEVISNVYLDTFNLVIPIFQRKLIESHVDRIINETIKYVINIGSVPFQPISVSRYQESSEKGICFKFHIIDAQHSYETYKKIYDRGTRFPVDIYVINCSDYNEAFYFYKLFNENIKHSRIKLQNPLSF